MTRLSYMKERIGHHFTCPVLGKDGEMHIRRGLIAKVAEDEGGRTWIFVDFAGAEYHCDACDVPFTTFYFSADTSEAREGEPE